MKVISFAVKALPLKSDGSGGKKGGTLIIVAGGFNTHTPPPPSLYTHKDLQKEDGKETGGKKPQHFTLWKFVLGLNNRKPIMQIITLTDSNPLSALHTVYILISIYFLLLSMTEQSSS